MSIHEFFQKTNKWICFYYYVTCFCSFFGRNWRHKKNTSKLSDLILGKNSLFEITYYLFYSFLNFREHKRKTYDSIPNFGIWQAVVLLLTGFLGGIFSAITGSGVDICSFSMLSLLFRVSEKVSTPTSIVLMAINTCVGLYSKLYYKTIWYTKY